MTEINKEVVYEISQKYYGVIPVNAVLVRHKSDRQVWRITDGNKDVFALKYVEKSVRAPIIAAVNDYIHGKGVPVTPVLSTLDGASLVNFNEGCFLLFQWLEGVHPSYAEPGMIEKMAMLLAKFHEASQGYVASDKPITNLRLDWNQIYKRKIKKMEKLREQARVSGDPFSKLFSSYIPWLQSRIAWILEQLPQTALSTLIDNMLHDPRLAHGDYSHHNLLRGNNNELTVIDLDTVSIALPMRDISHLTTCMNHELGAWSSERFQLVLDAYQRIRLLTPVENELILLDQIFPHKAIRLSEKYFGDLGNSTYLHEFERCMAIDKEKLNVLGIGPL
jgi:spore coat protein I